MYASNDHRENEVVVGNYVDHVRSLDLHGLEAFRANRGSGAVEREGGGSEAAAMALPPDWRSRCAPARPVDFAFLKLQRWQQLAEATPNRRRAARPRSPPSRGGGGRRSRAASSSSRPPSRGGVGVMRESQYAMDIRAVTAVRLNNNEVWGHAPRALQPSSSWADRATGSRR
jgi:hypothetical protein